MWGKSTKGGIGGKFIGRSMNPLKRSLEAKEKLPKAGAGKTAGTFRKLREDFGEKGKRGEMRVGFWANPCRTVKCSGAGCWCEKSMGKWRK